MPIPNRRGPRALSDILGDLFTARGYGRFLAQRELEEAWNAAWAADAGQRPLGEVRRGVLNVTVSHPALLEELAAFRKPELLARGVRPPWPAGPRRSTTSGSGSATGSAPEAGPDPAGGSDVRPGGPAPAPARKRRPGGGESGRPRAASLAFSGRVKRSATRRRHDGRMMDGPGPRRPHHGRAGARPGRRDRAADGPPASAPTRTKVGGVRQGC